jgi:hypothetical protein
MSAASTPAPRANPGPTRYTLFWPVLIFLLGSGAKSVYQVSNLEDDLDSATRAVDQLDARVKHAQYERAKFFAMARDLVRLAPHDAAAEQIVTEANLRRLQQTNPTLMSLDSPIGFTQTDPTAVPSTNAAPVQLDMPAPSSTNSAPPTNAPPLH